MNSIIVERWGIQEEGRRHKVLGGGDFIDRFGAIGSAVVCDTGKAHRYSVCG
ncbi:MAG: hypothetical protein WBX01_15795 [Nitrososphaeraceae archaeon]